MLVCGFNNNLLFLLNDNGKTKQSVDSLKTGQISLIKYFPFNKQDWAANYWVRNGCPKDKLVIGMGLYGRSFTLKDPFDNGLMAHVRGKGEPGKFTREGGFLAYYEVRHFTLAFKNTDKPG